MSANLNRPAITPGPLVAADLHRVTLVCPLCTGNCDQGRRCPAHAPAEACTEVGADAAESMWRHRRTASTARLSLALVLLLAVAGYVANAIWPLA